MISFLLWASVSLTIRYALVFSEAETLSLLQTPLGRTTLAEPEDIAMAWVGAGESALCGEGKACLKPALEACSGDDRLLTPGCSCLPSPSPAPGQGVPKHHW